MSDNNEIIKNLIEIKQKMESLIGVAQEIEFTESRINPPQKKLSKKIKIVIALLLIGLLGNIGDMLKEYKVVYDIYMLCGIIFVIYASTILADKVYNRNPAANKSELRFELDQLETKWNRLAQEVYSYKLIPSKYLHPEYLDFLIECLEYERVDSLKEAFNLLDLEIKHNESLEIMSMINQNNEKIHNAMQDIGEKIDLSNENLRKIRKDVSWTAYNTSTLRPRNYVGKAVDDVLRS
jgi:uncharacterized protein YukE